LVDYEVTANEAELRIVLLDPDYAVIGITTDITLTAGLEIPAGKTVVLYAELQPVANEPLLVNGTLTVEGAGVLIGNYAANRLVLIEKGRIEVHNGTIEVDTPAAVQLSPYAQQSFGTGQLQFTGGTLEITGDDLFKLDRMKSAFEWVHKGTLYFSSANPIPEAIKPSVLTTEIRTTVLRRLVIDTSLGYNPLDPDTAETITVPAGMEFETDDPLVSLKTLDVAGTFTASAATAIFTRLDTLTVSGVFTAASALFNNVTDLTVSGTITAASATYDKVKTLVVDSTFNAGIAAFNSLESLTVNPGGAFTTSGSIGSDATDAVGIVITLKPADIKPGIIIPAGSATVGDIKKLKTSAIEGSLNATSFTTLDTNNTLTAAAGGAINGVTFPAVTPAITSITGILGPVYTVTSDTYIVPRDGTLTIAATSTLIIPTGKTLTIEPYGSTAGTGVIKALGTTFGGTITIDGVEGYTTTDIGVTGAALRPAVITIAADTVKLTNKAAINLQPTFHASLAPVATIPGIGSVTATTGPDNVLDGDNGTGSAIALNANTSLVVGITVTPAEGGEDVASVDPTDFTLDINAPNLQITDAQFNSGGTNPYVIITFTGVKLTNSELIPPAVVPPFAIGVITER
jgi:hypothetical protein